MDDDRAYRWKFLILTPRFIEGIEEPQTVLTFSDRLQEGVTCRFMPISLLAASGLSSLLEWREETVKMGGAARGGG